MTNWRTVGINYIRYSQIAAAAVRNCLKTGQKVEGAKRGEGSTVKITKWKDGKPIKSGKE